MKTSIHMALAVVLAVAGTQGLAFARGFGGFHAGGFGGGGFGGGFGGERFGGGGFEAGGFHAGGVGGGFGGERFGGGGLAAGGFHAGGLGGGGFDAGGFHAGGFEAGGAHAGGYGFGAGGAGASVSRGQLGSFLGLPTDGGMQAFGGALGGGGAAVGPGGAAAWRGGATGHVYQGPMGTTVAHGTAGIQGAAVGPGGAAAGGAMASGTAIEGPQGNVYTHGTTAARGFAAGPEGVVAGGHVAGGTAVQGPGGGVYAQGAAAGRGVAAGPNGAVAGGGYVAGRGYASPYGTYHYSPTYYHAQAVAGQRWFTGNPVFTPAWTSVHPWAWMPAGYDAAAWTTAAWTTATWSALGDWLAWNAAPVAYDYGVNVTYQDGTVYYGSQPAAPAAAYDQQAANLAGSGAAETADNAQWLPLGVFGLMAQDQKTPQVIFQLSVDKEGVLRGNCYNPTTGSTSPVKGAVDKSTQLAAWTVGDDKNVVVETGLYNLTQDESTALVHSGPNQTLQYLLVRIKQPSQGQQPQH